MSGRAPAAGVACLAAALVSFTAQTSHATIAKLAAELAIGLSVKDKSVVVACGSVTSDSPLRKGEDLSSRIAAIAATQLGSTARALPQPLSLAHARSLAKGVTLVYLQPEIVGGTLRVTADAYTVRENSWDRLRLPQASPVAHAFSSTPIDAEIRTFLPPIFLEQAKVHKFKHAESDTLAIGCGDVDGDGGLEVVFASRARIAIGKLSGTEFRVVRAVPWATLKPRVPVPLREPLATVYFSANGVMVGTTDRGGVLFGDDGKNSFLTGNPISNSDALACAIANPLSSAYEQLVDCKTSTPRRNALDLSRFDAIAETHAVAKDGTDRLLSLMREPTGRLHARLGENQRRTFENVGAELAAVDFDQDGTPEIITTADSGDDAIAITTWAGGNESQLRMKIPALGGVQAIAACPPEAGGAPSIVAAVGHEVWRVR